MENRQSVVRKVTALVTTTYAGNWRVAFDAFAKNGSIDHSGVVDVLVAAGVGFLISRPGIATEVMDTLDTTGSGSITFEQFNALAKVAPAPTPPK